MMRYKIVVLTLFAASLVSAQSLVDEEYFSDVLEGELTAVYDAVEVEDGIIVAGAYENSLGTSYGIVLRLNQIGEVVWSTFSQPIQINCPWVLRIELFNDGFIYAYGCDYIWKINAVIGVSEWSTPVNFNLYFNAVEIEDYDSSRFLISYKTSQYSNHLAFMDKSTGDTLASTEMQYENDIFQKVTVDPYGNILYGNGGVLHKFNGDNLSQRIWKQTYNLDQNDPDKIDVITELYCDQHGDIYVWGYDVDGSTDLILAKVSPIDGSIVWKLEVSGNNSLQDFKDQFGYLYMTFQHKYVGGGSSSFYSSKVNKSTGIEEWYSNEDMTPLAAGVCGSREAGNVLDIDCDGNAFVNGYYGDGNYGPAIWGLMKLSSQSGVKDYDVSIVHDSLICYDNSEGKGVAVINNVPIFVGNQEIVPWETKATFVALDTITGLPSIRHYIGANYQHFSSTVDIQNSNDSMFVLMQDGEFASLRMSTSFGATEWEFTDSSSDRTKAGCISINENSAYLAINRLETANLHPNNYDNTNAILFFKLNRNTGAILEQDSLMISGDIQLIEMESDSSGAAYLLYSDGSNVHIMRWNGNGMSAPVNLGSVSANVQSERPLNVLNNYSDTEILFSGEQNLFRIDKSTLVPSSIYSYPSSRNVYGLLHKNGAIVLSGDDGLGAQSLISIDTTNYSLNWDQTYQSGVLAGAIYDQDTIYTYGEMNGQIQVQSIVASTGISEWEYVRPNLSAPSATAYNLAFSQSHERFVVSGAENHMSGTSDVAIDRVDRAGVGSSILFVPDALDYQSRAYCGSVQFDSLLWVGGNINDNLYGKQGVNYLISLYQCPNLNSTDVQYACESLDWIDGNTYTTDNNTATWMLTNSFGCDSLVTLDLTVGDVNTIVSNNSPVLTAIDAGANYQWIDCNNNNSIIVGETNQSFTATVNGSYAVIITDGSCTDTSLCYSVAIAGLAFTEFDSSISIFPNPTTQELNVDLGQVYSNVDVEVSTLLGQVVFNRSYKSAEDFTLNLTGSKGVYLMTIRSGDKQSTYRVIKQ